MQSWLELCLPPGGKGGQRHGLLGLLVEKDWLGVPDVFSVLLDGPVAGELADCGNVVHYHGQPLILVLGGRGGGGGQSRPCMLQCFCLGMTETIPIQ